MVWNVLGVIHWLVSFSAMVMAGKALIKFEVTFGWNEPSQFYFTLKMIYPRKDRGLEPGRMGVVGEEEKGRKRGF